jgi:Short C-terminal domain/Astacin (Peptidase family M12A)
VSEATDGQVVCLPRRLPRDKLVDAARNAAEINPVNHPALERLARVDPDFRPTRERIAAVTTKYWGPSGIRLTVGFLDDPPTDLRARILSHMNAWAQTANVQFVETATNPRVRIARTPGDGHWSFLGTDIDLIPDDEPTMNLESFTMNTPDSEFHRVIRHEAGHTLGFPHEHMRRELVERIDPAKAIEFFGRTQGWNEEEVRDQVLTPLDESSLLGTRHADPKSIMCYQIPGEITKDGKPIIGGLDIEESDFRFVATIYPKVGASPPKEEISTLAIPELIGKLAELKNRGAITNEEFEAKKAELLMRI